MRAPGRINLIGEHTDYNGLPVLPMAINREIILIAAPRNEAVIQIHNTHRRFEPRTVTVSEDIEPYRAGDWGNYAKAAVQALYRRFAHDVCPLRGFNALVDGSIPMASGLASSSALVVAFAFAFLRANNLTMESQALAELLAEGEQYVGTRGGGMDQTICLMARENHALKIEFFPTRVEQIPIPPGYSFVVCHSMVEASKTVSARRAYNMRAAESRIAAALLGRTLAQRMPNRMVPIERIGDLYSTDFHLSDADIDSLVQGTFLKDSYTIGEVARALGTSEGFVCQEYLHAFTDEEVRPLEMLKVRSRCRHVLSEGRRVRQAADALRRGKMTAFGDLMYASHESCATDYEVSIPELDTLVAISRESGALGSRLTGAGFGGCTISLVKRSEAEKFVESVKTRYYEDCPHAGEFHRDRNRISRERVFVVIPVGGATYFDTHREGAW